MDTSKPGKGILASLEQGRTVPAPRARPARWPVPVKVVGGSVLAGAALVWWIYAAPAPDVPRVLPAVADLQSAPVAAPAAEPDGHDAAATIVEERPLPVAKVLAPAVPAVLVAQAKPQVAAARPKAARCEPVRRPGPVATPPDSDVTLLSALVAHVDSSDVDEPRLVDSTAALLQRCRRVGGEEGRLCRQRICTARDGDDACRAE